MCTLTTSTVVLPSLVTSDVSALVRVWDSPDQPTRCAIRDEGSSEEGRDHIHSHRQLHDGTEVDGQAASGDVEYYS